MARLSKLIISASLAAGALMLPALSGLSNAASDAVYVVAAGDSLSGIAARLGVSLDALLTANGLTLNSLIVPGQQLHVPDAPAQASGRFHTVVAGDTLSGIAQSNQVALADLLELNGLTVNSLIMPGIDLALPVGATGSTAAAPSNATSTISTGNTSIDTVLAFALAQVGKPYVFFTHGGGSFDCSGLTMAAYGQVGVQLVHHAATQAQQGVAVDYWNGSIRAGDLVFLDGDWDGNIDHVGMATSASTWVQASQTHGAVVTGPLPSKSVIIAVRRMVG